MKKCSYLIILLILFVSCGRSEREPFEKAINEVYGSKVEYDPYLYQVAKEHGEENYVYNLEYDSFKDMIYAFCQLGEKIDGLMNEMYPSHQSLPSFHYVKQSLTSSNPITYCIWSDGGVLFVHLELSTSKSGNNNSISLVITRYKKPLSPE